MSGVESDRLAETLREIVGMSTLGSPADRAAKVGLEAVARLAAVEADAERWHREALDWQQAKSEADDATDAVAAERDAAESRADFLTEQLERQTMNAGIFLAERDAAVARAERAEERIRELALMFGVPDGGRYINDWKARAALEGTAAEGARPEVARAVALALAFSASTMTAVGDAVPQDVWDSLHAEGLVETVRIYGDDGDTPRTTDKGREALIVLAGSAAEPEATEETA